MKTFFTRPQSKRTRFLFLLTLGVVLVIILNLAISWLSSPAAIRKPVFEHYHLRMQVVVNGKTENFSAAKYQQPSLKDACAADLVAEPFHFHDKKDQMLHVHWDGMTGGLLLKYYGWNQAGGSDDVLGYRYDDLPSMKAVPIKGKALPAIADDVKLYVYTGDETAYEQKDLTAFLHQDLEDFLGKKSSIPAPEETSFIDKLFPKAAAHAGHDHDAASEEDLKKLNNLLGNIVIFAQKDKPSDKEVKARFADLEPLPESSCAG